MRILVTGATGLIGTAVTARLNAEGHAVVAVTRRGPAADRRLPAAGFVHLDLRTATSPEVWTPHLAGIDAVVNCAGVFQDGPGDSTSGVHTEAAAALFEACVAAGIRRVVHISAIGIDRAQATPFARSKLAGDQALMELDLDWVILRPAVVVGRAAYGGSALFRGLAAFPVLALPPDSGLLQVVQLDELAETVAFFMRPGVPAKVTLEVAGPDRLPLSAVVLAYRRWLGLPDPPAMQLPNWASWLAYRAGDVMGWFGWRSPLRRTAQLEMVRGAVGDPGPWMAMTGIQPRSLQAALAAEPASVQERWFARLYLLKPVVITVLALFWLTTGLISLGPGYDIGEAYMSAAGVSGTLGGIGIVLGASADILVGIGISFRRSCRRALQAGLALSAFYVIAGTILLPVLWIDPVGPMLKIWSVVALLLVAIAIVGDR